MLHASFTEQNDNTKLSWFKRWLGGLLCVNPDPRQMSGLADKETAWPAANLSDFANWYRHLRLESDDRPLLDELREAVEGFETMDLKDAGLGNRVLKVTLSSQEGRAGTRGPRVGPWLTGFPKPSCCAKTIPKLNSSEPI